MSATATCLLGLVAWSMILTMLLLTARTAAMIKGHPVNTFTQDGGDLAALKLVFDSVRPQFSQRTPPDRQHSLAVVRL